ncbi:hypothetical protein SK128_006484 [Halocaridina rubra]|uniref:TELO2-interacting protein 1 n=1 Tax=Halocaridina rubra TaxID=373956 RepID=A0AAN9AAC2_HALRR
MDPQTAFHILQPASIAVARDKNISSVKSLSCAVEQVLAVESATSNDNSTNCINDLKEYLLFPLCQILKSEQKHSDVLLEEIVRCMFLIVKESEIDDFNIFQDIFFLLFSLLFVKKSATKEVRLSEECKQYSVNTVTALVCNSSSKVRERIVCDNFRPQLGHAVFICLQLAKEEKNRSLRIAAIECLLALGQQKTFNELSFTQKSVISKTFANFLPGIVTGLAAVITGDEKQGHKVTCAAIDGWSYFVTLVMRNEFLEEKVSRLGESEIFSELRDKLFKDALVQEKSEAKNSKFDLPEPNGELRQVSLPSVQIDNKWVNSTTEKLITIIHSITKLMSHSHWKVRLSLLNLAQQLISKCYKSLANSIVFAVQVIITLRSDDILDVGSAAQEALLAVMNVIKCNGGDSHVQKGLYELLEEHVYALATQLPTIFRQQDDTKTLSRVRQLVGCLEVLGERIGRLMTCPSHASRLLRSLSFGFTLDVSDSDLLLEKTNAQDPFIILNIKPSLGRSFKYFQDVRIFQSLVASCRLIGFHSEVTLICDICLELLQETHLRKESCILFTSIIQGRDKTKFIEKDEYSISSEENEQVVRNILDVVISMELLYVPLVLSDSSSIVSDDTTKALIPVNKQQNISVDLLKSNVILVSNVLNLIGATAQMIGKDFQMFLSTILCSVLEKAGDVNVLVAFTAKNTLAEIANACQYDSVADLIENGVPYYWYSLSMKLKKLQQYPTAPLVLQVCLEYASIDVIAFTEELVEDVLLCLDTYHCDEALPLLRVLLVYILAVIRYEKKPQTQSEEQSRECSRKEKDLKIEDNLYVKESKSLLNFLNVYHSNEIAFKQGLEDSDSDIPVNDGINQEENVDNVKLEDDESNFDAKKNAAPLYIKHVVEILEKCSHMLFVQERNIKLIILEIIKVGTEALAKWENERLPVLHKLWKPLVLRLKDSDFVVFMRSFEALTVMAISSGDFLRRRILKEVLPLTYSFLKNQSHVSLKKMSRSGYYMTSGYRAQCTLLKNLPDLVKALLFGVTETGALLDIVVLYLDTRQPQQLQEYSFNILKLLSRCHPQHVWLALAYQQPSFRIEPPAPSLSTIKVRSKISGFLPNDIV